MKFFRFADTVGDGSGITNAAVDGSSAEVRFKLVPRPSEKGLLVHLALIHAIDAGKFDSGFYGNNITLANGITFGVYSTADDSLLMGATGVVPIKKNTDWTRYCHEAKISDYGTGNETGDWRWCFSANGAKPLFVPHGRYIGINVRDDLTGLVEQTFQFQGDVVR